MQIGRVPEIDNAQQNNTQKIQKVSETTETNKIVSNEEYKKALGSNADANLSEVVIDNVRFGFNKESKDFFIKVTKGDAEFKYPTEDMMKVKAFLMQELKEIQNKQG